MKRQQMKGTDWNKVKRLTAIGAIYILVVIAAFGTGTFNPNEFTLNKIKDQIEEKFVKRAINLGLHEPEFVFNDDETFIVAVNKCVDYLNFTTKHEDRIPSSLLIAMAGIESGWGTSRFAKEGNALFGVRTWDEKVPQMKPLDLPDAKFGVKTYITKCQSVADVIAILNKHPAYEEFRLERSRQLGFVDEWNYDELVPHIAPWSTNENYVAIILDTIKNRQLP